jgi:hypothetical protein
MKKLDGAPIRVTVVITESELIRLKKIEERFGFKRSEALRNMLSLGLDVYGDLEATGFVKSVESVSKVAEWLRKKIFLEKQPRLI